MENRSLSGFGNRQNASMSRGRFLRTAGIAGGAVAAAGLGWSGAARAQIATCPGYQDGEWWVVDASNLGGMSAVNAIQCAVNTYPKILLRGTFDFGASGVVEIRKDTVIKGPATINGGGHGADARKKTLAAGAITMYEEHGLKVDGITFVGQTFAAIAIFASRDAVEITNNVISGLKAANVFYGRTSGDFLEENLSHGVIISQIYNFEPSIFTNPPNFDFSPKLTRGRVKGKFNISNNTVSLPEFDYFSNGISMFDIPPHGEFLEFNIANNLIQNIGSGISSLSVPEANVASSNNHIQSCSYGVTSASHTGNRNVLFYIAGPAMILDNIISSVDGGTFGIFMGGASHDSYVKGNNITMANGFVGIFANGPIMDVINLFNLNGSSFQSNEVKGSGYAAFYLGGNYNTLVGNNLASFGPGTPKEDFPGLSLGIFGSYNAVAGKGGGVYDFGTNNMISGMTPAVGSLWNADDRIKNAVQMKKLF